jgi:tetratricopeptide (TPR) repeat protein
VAETTAIKYRAFLSYSHRDKAWGKWLHSGLESYRIDKDLIGRETPTGPVPKTLRPIFRDREDFSAGHSLTAQTIAALEASQFLIIICSPNAAQSVYVNEEVRRFKALGRAERIIPVIVSGEPGDPVCECFPQALRVKLGPDGCPTGEREEPIAADARPHGDGKEIAKQKVVAGLLGLGLDEIVRRAERARRRRNRIWAALAGVFLILAVGTTASGVYAWQQLKTNEALLDRTLKRATDVVDTAVTQATLYGVSRVLTLKLLEQAEGLIDDVAELGRETPQLRYRKAWMLIEFARNYEILGDTNRQWARAAEAHRLLALLVSEKPGDVTYQHDLSVAYNELGDVRVRQGNLAEALTSYRASLAIRERLFEADPNNAGWQSALSLSYGKVGQVLVDQGNLAEAIASLRGSIAVGERLTRAYPNNHNLDHLSVSYTKIGNALRTQANRVEALSFFRKSHDIREWLAKTEPNSTRMQLNLSGSYENIGDELLAQGELAEALASYRNSVPTIERLANADPSNTGWQRDLAMAYGRVGRVLLAQGEADQALTSFRDGLIITERLANSDPNNAGWQRDLSVSYEKVGDALKEKGLLAEALTSFRRSLAISERLAKTDPSNAVWQHDLSVFYEKVGGVLAEQGNLGEALASHRTTEQGSLEEPLKLFRNSLEIRERLAKADPGDTHRQRGLSMSYKKVGAVLAEQGNLAEARAFFRDSLAIAERLANAEPSSKAQWDVVASHWLLARYGDDDPARRWAFIVAEIRRLKDENRLQLDWARLLSAAEEQLARFKEVQAAPH